MLFPEEDNFSTLSILFIVCRVEAAWAFPLRISMLIGVVLVQFMFTQLCW